MSRPMLLHARHLPRRAGTWIENLHAKTKVSRKFPAICSAKPLLPPCCRNVRLHFSAVNSLEDNFYAHASVWIQVVRKNKIRHDLWKAVRIFVPGRPPSGKAPKLAMRPNYEFYFYERLVWGLAARMPLPQRCTHMHLTAWAFECSLLVSFGAKTKVQATIQFAQKCPMPGSSKICMCIVVQL